MDRRRTRRRSILLGGLLAAVLGLGTVVLPGVAAGRAAPASTVARSGNADSCGWEGCATNGASTIAIVGSGHVDSCGWEQPCPPNAEPVDLR